MFFPTGAYNIVLLGEKQMLLGSLVVMMCGLFMVMCENGLLLMVVIYVQVSVIDYILDIMCQRLYLVYKWVKALPVGRFLSCETKIKA